jgi:Na+/melibiose symporter-like transporter
VRFSFRRIGLEFASAWTNVSFRSLFVGFTLYGVFFGIVGTIATHINVFFWEFSTAQLQILTLPALLGFILGTALVGRLHREFDKRPTLIWSALASSVIGNSVIVLRLVDWLPANGSPLLLPIIFVILMVNTTIAAFGFVSAGSMMADVAERHEHDSGKAQGGIFFSATSFSGKLASGLGHFVAGVGLDLIRFPLQAAPSEVAPEAIRNLGLLSLSAALLALIAIYVFRFYSITGTEQAQIRRALEQRDASNAETITPFEASRPARSGSRTPSPR